MATTAAFPKIICRVRALYAFSSTEKSSLSFEKGEYIEVLSQLDSGWWDGWCRNNRGWFPSNYVQIIDMNPDHMKEAHHTVNSGRESPTSPAPYPPCQRSYYDDDDSEEEARTISLIRSMNSGNAINGLPNNNNANNSTSRPHSLILPIPPKSSERAVAAKINPQQKPREHTYIQRTPTSSYHDLADDEQHSNLPSGWVLQIADDGLTKFYFNQQTGGLRSNHPGLLDSDDDQYGSSGDEYDVHRRPYQASATEHTRTHQRVLENFDDYNDFGKSVKPKEAHHHRHDVFSTLSEKEPPQNIDV